MTTQQTFAQHMAFCATYVAPAIILSDEPIVCEDDTIPSLREQVSSEGLCYFQVKRIEHASYPANGEEDLYLAYVSAIPSLISFDHATMLLTEAQLCYALPWDARLAYEKSAVIIDRLHAHAAEVAPLTRSQAKPKEIDTLPLDAEPTFQPLPVALQVSAEDVQDVLEGICQRSTDKHMNAYRVQQAFLRVSVQALWNQLFQTQNAVCTQAIKTQCALIARAQRWHREHHQDLVVPHPIYNEEHVQTAWNLTICIPLASVAVA